MLSIAPDGWLQGHLLYLTPESRGKGIVPRYFDWAVAQARAEGLPGFGFWSTLPRWESFRQLPNGRIGFTIAGAVRQNNGVEALLYRRSE